MDLLENMTPAELARYKELLEREVALQSPLDLAEIVFPETKRWPQLELLNEHLVALAEYRLTAVGPAPAQSVRWWYEGPLQLRTYVLSPHDIPEQEFVTAYGAEAAYTLSADADRMYVSPFADREAGEPAPLYEPVVFQLAVSMMPRAGKSRLITEIFPLWLLLHDLDMQIGLATYSDTFAGDWGEAMKTQTIAHRSEREEGGVAPLLPYPEGGPRAAKDIFRVQGAKGKIRYTGTGGAVTGKTLHVLIADDLIKNEDDILSEATRESVHRFIDSTWSTRKTRNNAPHCSFPFPIEVRMATRWHRMDPIGYSCFDADTGDPDPSWCIVNIPALCVDPENDPLNRRLGEAHPNAAGLTQAALEKLRAEKPREFSALYQGNPVVEGGGLISSEFLPYWSDNERFFFREKEGRGEHEGGGDMKPPDIHSVLRSECVYYAVADMAATKKTSADYTVLGVFAYSREHDTLFIVDWYRGRITTDQYDEVLVPIILSHDCYVTVVENVTYGQAFGQGLEKRRMWVEYADTQQDKVARALSSKVSNRIRNGTLRVPRNATFLSQLASEVALFPYDEHDDQVDVLSFAALHTQNIPRGRPEKPVPIHERSLGEQIDAHVDQQHRRRRGKSSRGRSVWSRI